MANQLPKTANIKMVDIWMLYSLLLPFLEVLLHTIKEFVKNDQEKEQEAVGMRKKLIIGSTSKIVDVDTIINQERNVKVDVIKRLSYAKTNLKICYNL